jgi:phosphopantothenoylcysteine synthetase/decarboxylase
VKAIGEPLTTLIPKKYLTIAKKKYKNCCKILVLSATEEKYSQLSPMPTYFSPSKKNTQASQTISGAGRMASKSKIVPKIPRKRSLSLLSLKKYLRILKPEE